MAKKSAKPAARKMGRPVSAEGPRTQVLGIRARDDWKDWLRRFAEHCRSEMVEVVDDALEAYAKAKGFEAPPRR